MKRIRFQELRHMELQNPQIGHTLTESSKGQKGYDNIQKIRESEQNDFKALV